MAYSAISGRRRGIDPTVSRDRVLEAAEALILDGKFAQATVTELADKAGVSRATVFSRFGSKLGVLQELSVRCAGGPEMRAIRAAVAIDDPLTAVRTVIGATCNHWERQGHILLTLKAVAELEPGVVVMLDEQRADQRSSMDHIVKGLKRIDRLNGLKPAEAVAALHLITSVESFMELRRNAGLSLDATKNVLTDMALRLLGEP